MPTIKIVANDTKSAFADCKIQSAKADFATRGVVLTTLSIGSNLGFEQPNYRGKKS
jgi:hypothetical protein